MTIVKCDEECKNNIDGICQCDEIKLEVSFQDLYCHSSKPEGVD